MKKVEIELARNLWLPIAAVTQKFAFLGRTGSGKSYAASKVAEGMLAVNVPIVVLDPVGVWYGLRLAADGKSKGFSIPVLGGIHGDIALDPSSGKLIAQAIVKHRTGMVLDVSSMRKGQQAQFVADFCEEFFEAMKVARFPIHVFFEEAQRFVPQRVDASVARMVGAVEDVVRLGRNFGIGSSLISQRPQSVNKEVLNMSECLVVLQINGTQERKAVRDWIVEKHVNLDDKVSQLPSLPVGTAFVWSPQWLRCFEKVRIAQKETYDASSTPVFGAKAQATKLAPIDLEKLREKMAEVVTKAESEDPKKLRAKVAELERALTAMKGLAAVDKAFAPKLNQKVHGGSQMRIVKVPVLKPAEVKRIVRAYRLSATALRAATFNFRSVERFMDAAQKLMDRAVASFEPPAPTDTNLRVSGGLMPKGHAFRAIENLEAVGAAPPSQAERVHAERMALYDKQPLPSTNGDGPKLVAGHKRMLQALRWYGDLTQSQVALLSRVAPGGSSYRTYIGDLQRHGLAKINGDIVQLLPAGALYTTLAGRPATIEGLIEDWKRSARLVAGERKIVDRLLNAGPASADFLAGEAGVKPGGSSWRTYAGRLRRLGLITIDGDVVSLAELPVWRA